MRVVDIKLPGDIRCGIRDAVGIDFGTTNSLVAHYDGDGIRLLSDNRGHVMIKTTLRYEEGKIVVGKGGLRSIKRFIGANDASAHFSFGAHTLSTLEVATAIFQYLKGMVTANLDSDINKAVITVPAYYNDIARQITKKAATDAGFNVIRLISEPTAAAYAYKLDHDVDGIYCVYDFGGGTFDASILSMRRGCVRVLATHGDLFLGGDDIDIALARELFCSTTSGSVLQVKKIKEGVSAGQMHPALSMEKLEECARPFIARTIAAMDEAIASAKVSQLDGIILVGGSSRMPFIKDMLAKYKTKIFSNINPDEAVVYGAALRAYAIRNSARSLLLDVTPLSLGIEVAGGLFERLINKNTAIPATFSQIFTTFKDGQTAIAFTVCQGEKEVANENTILAKFVLKNIEPAAAGVPKIKVTFFLDSDGVLTVTADDEKTGRQHIIEVVPSYGLTQEEMQGFLRE